jgi:hypothetical protein
MDAHILRLAQHLEHPVAQHELDAALAAAPVAAQGTGLPAWTPGPVTLMYESPHCAGVAFSLNDPRARREKAFPPTLSTAQLLALHGFQPARRRTPA